LADEATHIIRKEGGPLSQAFSIGEHLGFDLWLRVSRFDTSVRELQVHLGEDIVCKSSRVSESATGSVRSLEYALRQLDADVTDAQDLLGRLEKQLIGARAQLGTDWEYLHEYTQIKQELTMLKAEMDGSEQGESSACETGDDDSDVARDTPAPTAVAALEAKPDEADPPPSANVLASQVQVREAVEAVWEMHRERYALTGAALADDNEPVDDEAVVPNLSDEADLPDTCANDIVLIEGVNTETEPNPALEIETALTLVPQVVTSSPLGERRTPKQSTGQIPLW